MQKAIAIIGYKNSGKTALAEALGQELDRRDIPCAFAKFSSHGFDRENTDTERLSRLCSPVLGFAPHESTTSWSGAMKLADLAYLARDKFLIVEGGKSQTTLPRIILSQSRQEVEELDNGLALATWKGPSLGHIPTLEDISRLADTAMEKGFLLPGLDCGTCNRPDCLHLAREIVAEQATTGDCAASRAELEICVNGNKIPLNGFLNDMISGSILGMLSPLKGFGAGEIDIRIKN